MALPRDVATYLKLDQSQDEIRVTAEEKQKFKEEQERFPDCASYYPGKESSELVASWTAYSILQCGVVHYHTEQLYGGNHVPVRKAAGIKIKNRVGAADRSQAVSIMLTDSVYDTSAYINHISADGIVDSWTRTSAILVPNTSCGQIKILVDRLRDFQGGAEVVMKYDEDRRADTCGADRLMRFLIATLKEGEKRHLNDMPVVKTGKTPGTEHRRMFTDADILAEIHLEVCKHLRIRSNLNVYVADFGEISERFAADQLKDYHTLRLVVRGEYPKRQTHTLARAWPHYFLDCDHLRFYFMLDFGNNAFMADDLETAGNIMKEVKILRDNFREYWLDPVTFMNNRVADSQTIDHSPYFLRYFFPREYETGPEVNEDGEATNDRVPHTPKPRDLPAAQQHKSAQGSAKVVPSRQQHRRTSQSSQGERTESEDSADEDDEFTVKKPRANPRGEDPRPQNHHRGDDNDGDDRGGAGGPVGGSAQRGGARRSNVASTPVNQKHSSSSNTAAQPTAAQSGNSKQSKHSDDTEYYDPMDYAFDRPNPVESPSKANVLDEILERLHNAEEKLKEDRHKENRPKQPFDEDKTPIPAYVLLYPAWPYGPYTAKQRALLDCLPMLYYQNLVLIKEQSREKDKLFFRPLDKLLKPYHSVVSDAERLDQGTTTIADTITILMTTAQGRNAPHGILLDAFNAPSTWSPSTFKLLTDAKQEAYRRAAQGVELPKRYETPHHKEFERCTMALADLILHLMERFHQPIAADRIKEAMKEVTLRTPHFGDLTTVYETLLSLYNRLSRADRESSPLRDYVTAAIKACPKNAEGAPMGHLLYSQYQSAEAYLLTTKVFTENTHEPEQVLQTVTYLNRLHVVDISAAPAATGGRSTRPTLKPAIRQQHVSIEENFPYDHRVEELDHDKGMQELKEEVAQLKLIVISNASFKGEDQRKLIVSNATFKGDEKTACFVCCMIGHAASSCPYGIKVTDKEGKVKTYVSIAKIVDLLDAAAAINRYSTILKERRLGAKARLDLCTEFCKLMAAKHPTVELPAAVRPQTAAPLNQGKMVMAAIQVMTPATEPDVEPEVGNAAEAEAVTPPAEVVTTHQAAAPGPAINMAVQIDDRLHRHGDQPVPQPQALPQ